MHSTSPVLLNFTLVLNTVVTTAHDRADELITHTTSAALVRLGRNMHVMPALGLAYSRQRLSVATTAQQDESSSGYCEAETTDTA